MSTSNKVWLAGRAMKSADVNARTLHLATSIFDADAGFEHRTDAKRAKANIKLSVLGALAVIIFLSACESRSSAPLATPTAPLSLTRTPLSTATSTPPATETPTPLSTVAPLAAGWREVRSGVAIREMYKDQKSQQGTILVVRIDPNQVDFHVRYQPDNPQHVFDWYNDSRSLIVMNSSFFDRFNNAVGQLTSDSMNSGSIHDRMEGAFYLTAVGAAVWPLRGWQKPAGMQIVESIESFPMYLMPGGLLNPNVSDDSTAARRTAVAVDRSGNVLFIVTAGSAFTLKGMGIWLANSDLNLDTALNFDGGSSSGVAVWTPTGVWGLDSNNQVPAVITVDPKVLGITGNEIGGEAP